MSSFIESQAEASEEGSESTGEISAAEWNAAFELAERAMEQRRNQTVPAPTEAAAAAPESPGRMEVEEAAQMLQDAINQQRGPRAQAEAAAGEPAAAAKPYNKPFRRVLFTLNNPGDFRPSFNEERMAYMVWQLENTFLTDDVKIADVTNKSKNLACNKVLCNEVTLG